MGEMFYVGFAAIIYYGTVGSIVMLVGGFRRLGVYTYTGLVCLWPMVVLVFIVGILYRVWCWVYRHVWD